MFGFVKLTKQEKQIINKALTFSEYTYRRRGMAVVADAQSKANIRIAAKLGLPDETIKGDEYTALLDEYNGSVDTDASLREEAK